MKFKGLLQGTSIRDDIRNPRGHIILTFTKSRIIFPKDLQGHSPFVIGAIKHNARYKLNSDNMDDLNRTLRYLIKVGNEREVHLSVDKTNERKLKLIHSLYPFQKNATAAIIIAILSLIMSTILGVLKLTGC